MEKEVLRLSTRQENDLLKLISSISFDFTFLYDVQNDWGQLVKYVEGQGENTTNIDRFSDFLIERVHPDDQNVLEKELNKAKRFDENIRFEVRLKESAGRRFRWHSVRMRLNNTDGRVVYVGSTNYIDSRKNKESALATKARQDPLTGLLNKAVTRETVTTYMKQNPNSEGAMIVLDIDNFKNYNDCLGHLFGDEVIKEVANRLRRVFAADSVVGRIGGDEFLVFVKNTSDITEIVNKMGKLRDALADITLGQKARLFVTCSIGISLYPDMGMDYDTLFQAADMALYAIKKTSKNNFAIYTEDLYDESVLDDGEKQLDEKMLERDNNMSLTEFAFQLLNESEDVRSALNLLLYKIQSDLNVDAIYVNELEREVLTTEVTYESHRNEFPSRLGKMIEFSHKALKTSIDEKRNNGGYEIFDLNNYAAKKPGNGMENIKGAGSMLAIEMRLFSKCRGVIDFVSRYGTNFWNAKKIQDAVNITNLIAVCIYYSRKVSRQQEEFTKFTEFDSLTGLMKEDAFVEEASKIIAEKGDGSKLAVIYSDISNFKYINEAYGYVTGDKILADMADYLANKVQSSLCTGRFYSDNILRIDEYPADTTDERVQEIASDINEALSQYLSQKYHINSIIVRSGVYVIPGSAEDALQSVSNANMARKLAKSDKLNKCVVFDRQMFEKRKRQIQFIQQLDDAIANEEFYVCLQPKVSGRENRLVGVEALVRWKTSDGREIMPDEFVPAFEKDGSIVKLDFYVYEKVMAYLRERLDSGRKVLPVSMNVSRAHLMTTDFVEKFRALIDKYQVPTQYIELELTESIYLENIGYFNEMMFRLRNMGIKISMDDFGSGYSSLNALNDLKIDLLKIDKVFMRDDTLRESDKTIIRFIIDMAKNLSMQVLCEGVETDSQRQFLNDAGCDLHQGYLYSKPVTLASFNDYIDHEDMLFRKIG